MVFEKPAKQNLRKSAAQSRLIRLDRFKNDDNDVVSSTENDKKKRSLSPDDSVINDHEGHGKRQRIVDFSDDIGFSIPESDGILSEEREFFEEEIEHLQVELDRHRSESQVFSDLLCEAQEESLQKSLRIEMIEQRNLYILRRIAITRKAKDNYRRIFVNVTRRFHRFLAKKATVDSEFQKTNQLFPIQYKLLKNNGSKKLRFQATLENIKNVTQEDDVESYIIDFLKYLDKDEKQRFRMKLSLLQTCIIKTKATLSRYQIEMVKKYLVKFLGYDVFPQVKQACLLAKEESMINFFEASQIPNNNHKITSVVQCRDVKKLLEWRLENLSNSKKLIFDPFTKDEIIISIGGDCGGGSTKINIIIGNVAEPNSTANISTIGVFDDSDSHDNIRKYLQPLVDQINRLEFVTYTENGVQVRRKVHQSFIGDFKLLSECLCHQKQRSKYFCTYCEHENPRGLQQQFLKDLDLSKTSIKRTLQSYQKYSTNGDKSILQGARILFECVKIDDYIIPMLHCVVGIFLKYIFWQIWRYCMFEDNFTRFEIFAGKEKTENAANAHIAAFKKTIEEETDRQRRKELEKELSELLEEREYLKVILNGLEGGIWVQVEKAWERMGATRQAFFQTYNGNHVKCILTEEGVKSTFSVFKTPLDPTLLSLQKVMQNLSKIMSLSGNVILDDSKLKELEIARNRLAESLKEALPHETITQKLHVMMYHMVEHARVHRTLGHMSEQGIEATHALFNRLERRFVSFNKTDERYMYVMRELQLINMVHDSEVLIE
ncbi:unnamed protein product [Caenorhabditis brenneri]